MWYPRKQIQEGKKPCRVLWALFKCCYSDISGYKLGLFVSLEDLLFLLLPSLLITLTKMNLSRERDTKGGKRGDGLFPEGLFPVQLIDASWSGSVLEI